MEILRLFVIYIVGAISADVISPRLEKIAQLNHKINKKSIKASAAQKSYKQERQKLRFCLFGLCLLVSIVFYFCVKPQEVIWQLFAFSVGVVGRHLPLFFKTRGIWKGFLASACIVCFWGAGFFQFNWWWSDFLGRGEYNLGFLGLLISFHLTGVGYLIAKFVDRKKMFLR